MTEGKGRAAERKLSVEEETVIANEALEQIWDILEELPDAARLAVCTLLKRLMPDLELAMAAVRNRGSGFDG